MKKVYFLLIFVLFLIASFCSCSWASYDVCSSHEFQCSYDHCISKYQRCDGWLDCDGGYDEINCSYSRCPPKEFPCDNGNCIGYVYRCDGDNDCADYSDEKCDPFLDHFLLVADNGKFGDLYQIDLHTNVMLPLKVRDPANKTALAFDPRLGDIYWTDFESRSIKRYSLISGSKTIETIFRSGTSGTLESVALDLDNNDLYYCQWDATDKGHGLIGVMSLNGSGHRPLVSEKGARPRSIVLDTRNRLMYWADRGSRPAIVRARMRDGGDKTVIVQSNIKLPTALAIDFEERVLYWGDAGLHRIERLNLSHAGDRQVVLDEAARNASYHSFALSPDFLYLTDQKHGSLRKLQLKTLRIHDQFPTDVFTRLSGVVFYNSYGVTPLAKITTITTADDLFSSINQTEVTNSDNRHQDPHTSKDSSVVTVVTVVVGAVLITIVITVGVVMVKARRARSRLLLEKRLLSPPTDRGNNSYFYSPFDAAAAGAVGPSPHMGANGEAPTSSSFSSNPFFRIAATRTSSFKPIITEDALQTNNVYSTVVGDYENIDTYEIIEDPLV